MLSENCLLLEADNVSGQISVHIFASNGGCCLSIPWLERWGSKHETLHGLGEEIDVFQSNTKGERDRLLPELIWPTRVQC